MSSLVPKLLWLSYTSIGWRARRLLQNQILMTDTQTTHTVGHTTVPIVDIRQRVADRISVLSVGASLCFIVRLVLYSTWANLLTLDPANRCTFSNIPFDAPHFISGDAGVF
jgi:hypothetical protein